MSKLSERIEREPDYRPYCLSCSTMMRMTLMQDKRTMWCEPVRDTTLDRAAKTLGWGSGHTRRGCDTKFDIFSGEFL